MLTLQAYAHLMCRVVNVFTVKKSMHRNSDEALLSTAYVDVGCIVCRTLRGLQCIVHIFGMCKEFEIFRMFLFFILHSHLVFGLNVFVF